MPSESQDRISVLQASLLNTKKPRVNYLQACQWGVCSDISDKGTAVSVNERHKSVHNTIKDKGTAAVIPLNYLPVRGMHQDRRQRSRRWGLHSCQGGVWSCTLSICNFILSAEFKIFSHLSRQILRLYHELSGGVNPFHQRNRTFVYIHHKVELVHVSLLFCFV